MKPIVIYFSAETGKTRKIAEKVAEKLAADLYRYELFAHGLFPDNEVDWLKNNADMMIYRIQADSCGLPGFFSSKNGACHSFAKSALMQQLFGAKSIFSIDRIPSSVRSFHPSRYT